MENDSQEQSRTIVISARVKKGHEKAFEELSTEMTTAATKFEGHLGAFLFRPGSQNDPEYRVVFKFDTQEHLNAWLTSSERLRRLPEIEKVLEVPSQFNSISSLITWFTLPEGGAVAAPPRYKMACVSWLAIFPLITLIFYVFDDILKRAPLIPRVFSVSVVVILLMTYVIMPQYTKFFRFWLYPDSDAASRRTR